MEEEIKRYTEELFNEIFGSGQGTLDEFDWEDISTIIEDTAKHFYSLRPSWKPSEDPVWRIWENGACGNSDGTPIAIVKEGYTYRLVNCLGAGGEKYIMLSDLEKLPGFNED